MFSWLSLDPSHRWLPFRKIPSAPPEFQLEQVGGRAIRSAIQAQEFNRRGLEKKGFSSIERVNEAHLEFTRERMTWNREELLQQAFSDEHWNYGYNLTQSHITILTGRDSEAVH